MSVYLHDWSDVEGVKRDFDLRERDLDGVEILFASYAEGNYSGDAFVLFRRDGKYYEVNGGHCSCFGLEDQWEPEEASLEELKHRLQNGKFGRDDWTGNEFADELLDLIAKLEEVEVDPLRDHRIFPANIVNRGRMKQEGGDA